MDLPFDRVEELFATRFAAGLTPGLVYGVVREGELVHHGSFGTVRVGEDTRPGADSVFRIASMSKSFTAAALLLLRERGLVDLDEVVAQYVPELVDLAPYSPGSPALTLRLLLSMGGGLLTDDPWGDRQESLTYDAFGTFLDGGITLGREPGVGFEYSNLGYALLGRVVENVVGGTDPAGAHRDFVEHELLAPLGMTDSRYDAAEVGAAWVPGYRKGGGGWVEVPVTPPGAFSAMGGLHSSVRDLARWIGGFTDAFRPERDPHPLSKASRREMQQLHRFTRVTGSLATVPDPDPDPEAGTGGRIAASAFGYGFGLQVEHDAELGHFPHHSGGYPGYGSQMVWHPESGIGVVTLSNSTYAGAYQQAIDATKLLVRSAVRPRTVPRLPATLTAVEYACTRLAEFDPDASPEPFADPAHFADNVEPDVPDPERRSALRRARERVGAPRPGPAPPVWSRAMAHAGWTIPAERGRYDLEILLSPEEAPRLQQLKITAIPPAPPEVLASARDALAADTPMARRMRGLGEVRLVESPMAHPERGAIELLAAAGGTWWKVLVEADDVHLEAHPTSAYPRLAYLARMTGGVEVSVTT